MIPAPVLLAELSRRLNYDRSSGKLTRKAGPGIPPWGAPVGTPCEGGRLQCEFLGKRYQVSHLVWLLETGDLPRRPLRHIDGDPANCRFVNLTEVPPKRERVIQCATHGQVQIGRNRSFTKGCPSCALEGAQAKIKKTPEARAESRRARHARRRATRREHVNRICRESSKRNRPKWRQDPQWRASNALHAMVTRVAKDIQAERSKSHRASLGYTTAEFKAHIEQQFEPWMTWTNHGEWHIDHIVPVLWFVERGITDPAVVNALANLRPIARAENLRKSWKVEPRAAAALLAQHDSEPKRIEKVL